MSFWSPPLQHPYPNPIPQSLFLQRELTRLSFHSMFIGLSSGSKLPNLLLLLHPPTPKHRRTQSVGRSMLCHRTNHDQSQRTFCNPCHSRRPFHYAVCLWQPKQPLTHSLLFIFYLQTSCPRALPAPGSGRPPTASASPSSAS